MSRANLVHRLDLPTPYPVGPVAVYFIEGAEPALIDTGVASTASLDALERQLAALGRRVEDIRSIFLTHGHYDHAGAALLLSRRCGATLHLHEQSTLRTRIRQQPEHRERLRVFLLRCGMPEQDVARLIELFSRGEDQVDLTAEPHAVVGLTGGQHVQAGDLRLEVVATPGHSADSLTYHDPAGGQLFCGDTLLARITPNPLLHLDPAQGYQRRKSLLEYLESLDRLAALSVRRAHPGHGEIIEDVPWLIRHNLEFVSRRRSAYLRRLGAGPLTPDALAGALFGQRDLMSRYLALSETVAYLDLLEREGAVTVDWEGGPILIRRKER